MNNEIIVFELPDGSVRIFHCPAKGKRPGEIKSVWLNRVFKKCVTDHAQYAGAVRIKDARRPDGNPVVEFSGELFCDAWRHTGNGQLQVDMPEARNIKMDRIRGLRDVRLQDADGPTAREVEQNGPDKGAWFAHKQVLRDMPATIDLDVISTPEELESFTPTWPIAPGEAA